MDFNALQHKLFALDPTDPAEDLRKLTESAGSVPQENAPITESLVQESVEVQEGTMPVEGDYSLSDFAALAGVTLTEAQKKGSAGQAKGKDPTPKTSKPSRTGEQPHPLKDKLVGEGFKDGWDNAHSIELFKKMAGKDAKEPSKDKISTVTRAAPDEAPGLDGNVYKAFLKKHTVSLQQIAADPKKTIRFERWLEKWNESVEEESKGLYHNVNKRKKAGTSRKQGHPKAPTAQAWKDAAKTAKKESVESIKDMLYRKLNDKK
jgi:hypothetical protein